MPSILLALAVLIFGAVAALLSGRNGRLASLCGALTVTVAGLLVGGLALRVLISGQVEGFVVPWAVPGAAFALQLDGLAAFFLLPLAVVGICCAVFGASYMREEGRHRALGPHWFFFNLLIASMILVVTTANGVLFLAAWELMTLTSFFLVAWDHAEEKVRRAAWLYLLAAHGGLVLLLTFFLLAEAQCGSLNFSDFGSLMQLPVERASVLFLLALAGFGVKAGLLPLHIWLPDAHPAAPSHVSALMSAVLVKTGLYGILRVLTLLPPAPQWWGWTLALIGALGAFYGIALASVQRDIKRCLAYSTIENIGIIVLGLGFGLVALSQGRPSVAALAFSGGLLHIWNHALFKGLMFLGAGAIVHATGTRDMNRMGGLLHRMPLAGMLWIGGSLSISALPPFNGLISEWLIYLGLLRGGLGGGFSSIAPFLLIGLLGLVGALALVTFSRLAGICLLGEPRDKVSAQAHEAPILMLAPMAVLLLGCLAVGLAPSTALEWIQRPLEVLMRTSPNPVPAPVVALGAWGLLLLASVAAAFVLLRLLQRRRPSVQGSTWGCGFTLPTARMSYTGDAYSELCFRHVLPHALQPDVEGGVVTGLFPAAARLSRTSTDPVLQHQLRPFFNRMADRCLRLRWLQQGRLSIYLLYMFASALTLMAWVFLWERGG